MVREIGLSREEPLPDGHEILIRLREKGGLKRRENKAPVRERIAIFHEEIEKLLKQRVNFKQILRLIEERVSAYKLSGWWMDNSFFNFPFDTCVYIWVEEIEACLRKD